MEIESQGRQFLTVQIDGNWHNGWFRIKDGCVEVWALGRHKAVEYLTTRVEHLAQVPRALLAEIVRDASSRAESRPEGAERES